MRREIRTAVYDDELHIEAYSFQGIEKPFLNHFHEYYVIGYVEKGTRVLSCKNKEYRLKPGNIVLFNPGDSQMCIRDRYLGGKVEIGNLKQPACGAFYKVIFPVFK